MKVFHLTYLVLYHSLHLTLHSKNFAVKCCVQNFFEFIEEVVIIDFEKGVTLKGTRVIIMGEESNFKTINKLENR